jgi:hypothetical protein
MLLSVVKIDKRDILKEMVNDGLLEVKGEKKSRVLFEINFYWRLLLFNDTRMIPKISKK